MPYDQSIEKDFTRIPEAMWRRYSVSEACVFKGTNAEYGEFSNMASGFPLTVLDQSFNSSEALYQCCRYPYVPDAQRAILAARNGMHAKMISKHWRPQTREDWMNVRVSAMRWVLRKKLIHHPRTFGLVLLGTGSRPIVEESSRDVFWGAKRSSDFLEGANVLGRLLMELRSELDEGRGVGSLNLAPPPGFRLFGVELPALG